MKPLGKIETKKMMAHPLNEAIPDAYELCKCKHCSKDYLSQCDIEKEMLFCPLHINYESCVECESTFPEKEMKLNEDEYYCLKCVKLSCLECNGEMTIEDSDGKFCSRKCYIDYWADMDEDEYKNY